MTSYNVDNNGFNYNYNSNRYFYGPYNHVRDFDKLQGMTHASDQHIQPLRDINHRYISVENSGQRPVGIAIRTYAAGYAGNTVQTFPLISLMKSPWWIMNTARAAAYAPTNARRRR